ncbi:MAG: primase-helicase zinc-binding domain-containing protein [Aureliella sp.]
MRCKRFSKRRQQREYVPASELKSLASGQWLAILNDAGLPASALEGRRGRPCPRCGGRDRFSPMADIEARGAVLCRHCHNATTDPRAGDGIATLRWWFACDTREALEWLAKWLNAGPTYVPAVRPVVRSLQPSASAAEESRFELMAELWQRNMRPAWLERAASLLGLPAEPLKRLDVGWSPAHRATSWPMRDAAGSVVGIRLRCPKTAKKWAVKGSQAGLIYPTDLSLVEPARRLVICEGPTDTASLLSVGIAAVGAPSAGCGVEYLDSLARRLMPREVVILADADAAGVAGAKRLATRLILVAPVRIATPPESIKDARAWVCSGASRTALEASFDAAPLRKLGMGGRDE